MSPAPRLPRSVALLALALAWASPPAARAQTPPRNDVLAEATFDFVWERIRDTYYDPTFHGVDWNAVREELRPRALAARSTPELRAVLTELIGRLGESHFAILPGPAAASLEPEDGVLPGDADPGLDLRWEEGELLVTRVRPDSPADRAGVRPGWSVVSVGNASVDSLAHALREAAPAAGEDRFLALQIPVAVLRRLQGPRRIPVEVGFRPARDAATVSLQLERTPAPGEIVVFGNLPPIRVATETDRIALPNGGRVEVARWSAWFPSIVPRVAEFVDGARDAQGIVIDLRGNPGGIGALVMGIGGHFLAEPVRLGTMRTRETELHFVANPQRVTADGRRVEPYAGPLAILVDALTGSTSEFFAGALQTIGRARIFGGPTAGQALPAVVVELPNGDRLMHVLADFTGPDGARLEGSGVRPDVPAPPGREALLAGHDPALDAAVNWILATLENPR